MMLTKIRFAIFISLIGLLLNHSSFANADSNKNKPEKNPTSATSSISPAAAPITVSTWLSPNLETIKGAASPQTMIKVNAGAAIPLKFRLFNSGAEVKSTNNVNITSTTVTCVGASQSTASNNLQNVTPGKSIKSNSLSSVLKYNSNSFNIVWKTAKSSKGCFQFKVTFPTGTLNSPIFNFTK